MSDKAKPEFSLDQFSEAETDEEFGLPEFKEHFADTLTPAVLRDWTAKDFASIYVRFRPHLERHARRFLVNPSQVEEVVQDAFLYLMTTLPELDSELGVLKFLKWKVRLLSLDVIRANSRASISPLEELPDIESDEPETSQGLERAEDAAIVSMALAKLQPRQREALIATLYEEKSTEVVASQMGLSENAFRQLLFRARSSFKKALVGEAETAGMSAAEILSVAARKAASESGRIISAAGAFLLVLAVSIGVLPNLNLTTEQTLSLPAPATSPAPQQLAPVEEVEEVSEPVGPIAANEVVAEEIVAETAVKEAAVVSTIVTPQVVTETATTSDDERPIIEDFMLAALDQGAVRSLSSSQHGQLLSSSLGQTGTMVISNGSGLTANIAYDLSSESGIQHVWVSVESQGHEFVAVPRVDLAEKLVDESGNIKLRYIASDFLVGDVKGDFDFIATDRSAFSAGALRLEINLDQAGNVMGSTLYLTSKS